MIVLIEEPNFIRTLEQLGFKPKGNSTSLKVFCKAYYLLHLFYPACFYLQCGNSTIQSRWQWCSGWLWLGEDSHSQYGNLFDLLLARVIFKVQDDTSLGLKSSFSGALKHLLFGFILGGIFVSIVVGALSVTGGYRFVAFNESPNIMPFFLLFFVGAFNEELVFRGFIFQDLERVIGTKTSILISSFLFGFVHMINHVPNVTPESQMVFCTFLSLEAGLPFVMAFILTRSIWLAVGIHWAWNFFEGAVFGANVSGHELNSAVMLAKLSEGICGGGGAFGPENTLVNLFAGIGLFYLLYRLK